MSPCAYSAVGLREFGGPLDGVVAVLDVCGLVFVAPHPVVLAVGGVASAHVLDDGDVSGVCDVDGVFLVARGEFVVGSAAGEDWLGAAGRDRGRCRRVGWCRRRW